MANDFTNDTNCKALWRFESGALTTDSIGGNDLTNNGVAESTGAGGYKEGSCSADFEAGDNDYLKITDADLDAGFPLKNGDATKKISIAFWCKFETVASTSRYLITKYHTTGKRSFAITQSGDSPYNLQIVNGYNNGDSAETKDLFLPVAGRWYHIGVAHDGVNKTLSVRVWDDTAGSATTYTHNWGNETNIEDADFVLGTLGTYSTTYDYDGLLDEVVVFSDLKTTNQFDEIRLGIYSAPIQKIVIKNSYHKQLAGKKSLNSIQQLIVMSAVHNNKASKTYFDTGALSTNKGSLFMVF